MSVDIPHQLAVIKRGAVELVTEAELRQKLAQGRPLRIKAGFDPTAPDLHLGHTVLLQKLKQFQGLGHQIIFLIGDFTARIGDPSGRSTMRPPLSDEQIHANMRTYEAQVFRVLDRNKTEVRCNSEWIGGMSVTEMIRLCSQFTVARMLERNDFKQRIEAGIDVSVLEFYYPLLTAYDSVVLKADVELGGTDQKFNLLLGRTIQRRYGLDEQVVLTMPLLIGTDGAQKMSKSYGNHIGIAEPPGEMLGKVMSISDELMWSYYELLSDRTVEAIAQFRRGHPKAAKVALAKELVARFHSADAADAAETEFERVFGRKERPSDAKAFTLAAASLLDVLEQCGGVAKSRSELRRLIRQKAVRVNDAVVIDVHYRLGPGEYWIRAGTRWHNKVVIR
ncbi:MAG: tyrosine--tRNA ligase [Deltaproteobacteria bacterium]|nr:tyrosine--tRNA ligase [Deltaproteobacteria bacterium]